MASAAAGQNKAFGIDRGLPFPVADIARTKALLLWGANCAETMPPLMQWIDEQQSRRQAHRRRPAAHRDRPPGGPAPAAHARVGPGAGERPAAPRDRRAPDRPRLHRAPDRRASRRVRRAVMEVHPAHVERLTGVSIDASAAHGPLAGRRGEQHAAVGPRTGAAVQGRRHRPGLHQPDAGARQGGQAGQRVRLPDRTGQRAGRARARTEGRPAPRLPDDRRSRAIARRWRASGASTRPPCRARARAPTSCSTRWDPRAASARCWSSDRTSRWPRRTRATSRASWRRSTFWSCATRSTTRPRRRRTPSCRSRSGPKRKAP